MAFWDRFRRKKEIILPEEVSEYYQSQRHERVGVAVILGIIALIVTLLIATALFFSGRFIYRKLSDNDKREPVKVQTGNNATQQPQKQPTSSGQQGNNTAPSQNSNPSSGTTTPRSNAQTSQTSTQAQSSTPATGDDALPHTGDPGM